jgi:hypothetical protein
VPVAVKTGVEFRNPAKTYGIGVVLAYRSTDANWNTAPPDDTLIAPVVAGPPACAQNTIAGAGCP